MSDINDVCADLDVDSNGDRELTREEINAWRCECGAGPKDIIWRETVDYIRAWNGEWFVSVDEKVHDVEFVCSKCWKDAPRPIYDIIHEAINS